jgi:hypothetical protein
MAASVGEHTMAHMFNVKDALPKAPEIPTAAEAAGTEPSGPTSVYPMDNGGTTR